MKRLRGEGERSSTSRRSSSPNRTFGKQPSLFGGPFESIRPGDLRRDAYVVFAMRGEAITDRQGEKFAECPTSITRMRATAELRNSADSGRTVFGIGCRNSAFCD